MCGSQRRQTEPRGSAVELTESLEAMVQADPRTRDSIWQGVSLALSALADPRVLEAVSPRDDAQFEPEASPRERGPLSLRPPGAGAGAPAALVAAMIKALVEPPRRRPAPPPAPRPDPPLLLALDEI